MALSSLNSRPSNNALQLRAMDRYTTLVTFIGATDVAVVYRLRSVSQPVKGRSNNENLTRSAPATGTATLAGYPRC